MNSLIFSYFTLLQWYILAKVKVVRSIYHINVLRIAVFKGSILMGKYVTDFIFGQTLH